MQEYQRRVATFLAKLVSLADLAELSESDRQELGEEYFLLCFTVGFYAVQAGPTSPETKQRKFAALVKRAPQPKLDPLRVDPPLTRLQKMARSIILPLLNRQEAVLPRTTIPVRHVRIGPSGTLLQTVAAEGPDVMIFELQELLRRGAELPFRRCPSCQTIFVPVRHQRYCSPHCTAKGGEYTRKDAKRIYMKAYMAKRRQTAKQATAA
jgi:hypothetical protein